MALRTQFKTLMNTALTARAATRLENGSIGVTVTGFGTGSIQFHIEVRGGTDDPQPMIYTSPVLAISVTRDAAAKRAFIDELTQGVLEELNLRMSSEPVRTR